MTDREKLIELISDFVVHVPHEEGQTWEEACADHLLANGVTVQQWISVKDQMPDYDIFLGISRFSDKISIYQKREWEKDWVVCGLDIRKDIRYWMPMPQPPKEVL